jgi:hypothetical protein
MVPRFASSASYAAGDRTSNIHQPMTLAGWPRRGVLRLLFDREHNHRSLLDNEKDRVGKATRQGAMNPDCDLRE